MFSWIRVTQLEPSNRMMHLRHDMNGKKNDIPVANEIRNNYFVLRIYFSTPLRRSNTHCGFCIDTVEILVRVNESSKVTFARPVWNPYRCCKSARTNVLSHSTPMHCRRESMRQLFRSPSDSFPGFPY